MTRTELATKLGIDEATLNVLAPDPTALNDMIREYNENLAALAKAVDDNNKAAAAHAKAAEELKAKSGWTKLGIAAGVGLAVGTGAGVGIGYWIWAPPGA